MNGLDFWYLTIFSIQLNIKILIHSISENMPNCEDVIALVYFLLINNGKKSNKFVHIFQVIATVEGQRDQYEEFLKRGQKLVKNPNAAPFLAGLIEKLETTWKEANEKSVERADMLKSKFLFLLFFQEYNE